MMAVVFDFLTGIFGTGPQYQFQDEPQRLSLDRAVGTREVPARSMLGSPVIDNIRFEAGSYSTREGQQIQYAGLTIDSVLMVVTQAKNIIRTQVAGRDGSVKEYMNDDDFRIQMRIGLYGSGAYPAEEVSRMLAILKAPAAVRVISQFLNQLGIYELVVSSYTIPQLQSSEYAQTFDVECFSDRPFELLADAER